MAGLTNGWVTLTRLNIGIDIIYFKAVTISIWMNMDHEAELKV